MRVSHRDACDLVNRAGDFERIVDDPPVGGDRDPPAFENRLAHVDFDEIADKPRPDDAGERFHLQLFFLRETAVFDILGKAADAVAAHLDLAAVGVVDLHLEVGALRWMNRQQLVGADAEAPVAEFFGERAQVARRAGAAIDENKIVAATVHLGKMQLAHLTLEPFTP